MQHFFSELARIKGHSEHGQCHKEKQEEWYLKIWQTIKQQSTSKLQIPSGV
jgi:hypothetical protein